jgi:hypothetical protein
MIQLATLLLLFSPLAMADMVFIDLNNVEAEIALAQAEAARRVPKENLIILPLDRTAINAGNKEFARLTEEKDKLSAEYDKSC